MFSKMKPCVIITFRIKWYWESLETKWYKWHGTRGFQQEYSLEDATGLEKCNPCDH